MASKSTKGLHRTVALITNGVTQAGSFAKVRSFSVKPDATVSKTDHLGATTSVVDLMHHGWDGNFTIEEEDQSAALVYEGIAQAAVDGTTPPRISLMEIRRYVDPALIPQTFIYEDVILKLDEEAASGRKEYNTASFTFAATNRKRVG